MSKRSYADIKERKKPLTAYVDICIDDEIARQHEEAVIALGAHDFEQGRTARRASSLTEEQKLRAEQKRDELEAEVERTRALWKESAERFWFRAIGREAYEALVREHPATEEDHANLQEEMGQEKDQRGRTLRAPFHGDTFVPALIAAASVDPKLSLEDAVDIYRTWQSAEITELFQAAQRVNTQKRVTDLGKGS